MLQVRVQLNNIDTAYTTDPPVKTIYKRKSAIHIPIWHADVGGGWGQDGTPHIRGRGGGAYLSLHDSPNPGWNKNRRRRVHAAGTGVRNEMFCEGARGMRARARGSGGEGRWSAKMVECAHHILFFSTR